MNSDYFNRISVFANQLTDRDISQKIAEKERELKIKLPEVVRHLYQYFNPQDPIFSVWIGLLPIEQIRVERKKCDVAINYGEWEVVTLFENQEWSFGYALCRYSMGTNQIKEYFEKEEDYPIFAYQTSPKKSRKNYMERQELKVEEWVQGIMGFLLTYGQPYVITADLLKISSVDYKDLWSKFEQLLNTQTNIFTVWLSNNSTPMLGIRHKIYPIYIARHGLAIGSKSEQALSDLIQRTGLKFIWAKKGSESNHNKERILPKERSLYSVEAVFQYLSDFAGLHEKCAVPSDIEKFEKRTNEKLPIPLQEFYQYLPKKFYDCYNTIRPLSRLKPMKDGMTNFLEENQGIYCCAAKPDSPFVYQKALDSRAKWEPAGILDGYLVSEFFWALACAEELEMELWEYPDFDAKMLDQGGKLFPYFSDIADTTQKISEGNLTRLYQVCGGKAIALYEKTTPKLYLLARTSEDLDEILEKFGFPKEE